MKKALWVQLVVVGLTLTAAACGGSPTSPETDSPSFQGVWQGTWSKASCSGVACDVVPSSGGFRLTLTQSGTQVQGSVELASFLIPASGSVQPDGTLSSARALIDEERGAACASLFVD